MRIVKFLLIIIVLSLSNLIYAQDYWTEKKVILTGRVLNLTKAQNHRSIHFSFFDIVEERISISVPIQNDGAFRAEILIAYPQEFIVKYGRLFQLLCSPGDSINMELNANIIIDQEGKIGKYVQISPGPASGINNNLIKFIDNRSSRNYTYINRLKAIKSKSAVEYTDYIFTREKYYRTFLKKFNSSNITDSLFQRWANDYIHYESLNDLIRYPKEYSTETLARGSNIIPDAFFSFMKRYNMDDDQILSSNHVFFLSGLYAYCIKKASVSQELDIGKLRDYLSGFTLELFFTKLLFQSLKNKDLTLLEALYKPDEYNSYFRGKLDKEYLNARAYLLNQNTGDANLADIKSDNSSELIRSITSKYKGKVVYIDFWGPWCAPCMAEMPNSKIIQAKYKEKDVIFLFLANRTKDDIWKATISNLNLSGEHINLKSDQFDTLSSELGINGVPHYTLLDKEGNIVLKSAPRPSSIDNLTKEIDRLLK